MDAENARNARQGFFEHADFAAVVANFGKPWNEAFEAADVPRRIFHDLRRTAVRNMIRAGVDQAVAMSISGHKTVSMFMRYNITSAADKLAALKRTAAHLAAQPKDSAGTKVAKITTGTAATAK